MQFGYNLHLVQQPATLLAIGLPVALLRTAKKVLVSLVDAHLVFVGHDSLR
jgi:hypothetical protein